VENIERDIASKEKERGDVEVAESERGKRIQQMVDRLMIEGQPDFARSRLMYCWHSSLSYGYKGDAAWIVKGEKIPLAKHVTLHDLVKVTGYRPREFLRENFLQHPERLQQLTESFGRIMGFTYCAIQFQPAPGGDRLSQAWVAGDGPFVPIDAFGDGARSVFKHCQLHWCDALQRLQIGGERGYGWGRLMLLADCDKKPVGKDAHCFQDFKFVEGTDKPILEATSPEAKLLAHAIADINEAAGEIEPLVGRETDPTGRFGHLHSKPKVCWKPGKSVSEGDQFSIGCKGIWKKRER
jgi:hypothetical protein